MTLEQLRQRLQEIHSVLSPSFCFGSLQNEQIEQLLCLHFIKPEEKVLEIGGNIGRCSCVIASILRCPQEQLVVIECNPRYVNALSLHSLFCRFNFAIEDAALSNKPLFITEAGLSSHTHEEEITGSTLVKTIKYQEFSKKYGEFTTLVIDCEGAFFSILLEYPAILNGVGKIIIENDFASRSDYEKMVAILYNHGFHCIFSLRNSVPMPCSNCFYQVYQRDISHAAHKIL